MRDPEGLLARAGVTPDTRQDQHFLVDDRVLDRLPAYLPAVDAETVGRSARAGDARSGEGAGRSGDPDRPYDHVLEVGAGTGALTDRLLAVADRVTAVERDPALADFLREEFAAERSAGRLRVLEGDALDLDLPAFSASVSNLPYGAASELLFELLPRGRPLVVTVQAEFAERMAANPGTSDYGRLSVSAGHYARPAVVEPVPPAAFSPPPAVDSAVVRTTPRDPEYAVPDDDLFLRFVKAVFTQRRKTMRNAVRNTAHVSGLADPDAVVDAADEALMSRRPDSVAPAEFARLVRLAVEVGAVEGVESGGADGSPDPGRSDDPTDSED